MSWKLSEDDIKPGDQLLAKGKNANSVFHKVISAWESESPSPTIAILLSSNGTQPVRVEKIVPSLPSEINSSMS